VGVGGGLNLDELRATATLAENGYHRFPAPYRQMSVTREEADFLYALVRATRPLRVLEIGAGLGLTAFFIAHALAENDEMGAVVTVEPVWELAKQAHDLLDCMPAKIVNDVAPFAEWGHKPDLVYIDSGQKYRANDITTWLTNGYTGPVLVHDAERNYPEIAAGVGVYIPTANGMWLGRSRKATEAT